jgi:hypothetical protein
VSVLALQRHEFGKRMQVFTSPRVRGEVDRSEARSGEGGSPRTELVEEPSPHPSPRKSGARKISRRRKITAISVSSCQAEFQLRRITLTKNPSVPVRRGVNSSPSGETNAAASNGAARSPSA